MEFSQFLNYFVALLVVSNPLSALPAVLKITRNRAIEEKRRIGLSCAFAVGCILTISTWMGTPLLKVFGIGLPAFQIAGGAVLFSMAFSMLNAEESAIKQTAEETAAKRPSETGAIVPLAIPIIAGPGAISTIIVTVSEFPGFFNQCILSATALLVAVFMGFLLYFASALERMLGQSGINIINRLGGLILMAIAIQNLAAGVLDFFPALNGKI